MDLLADLEARGLVHDSHRPRRAPCAPGSPTARDRLLRLRPDRRQPPHRQPGRRPRPAPVPGRRAPAHRPGRRGHGDDRRPERPLRGAHPARRGDRWPATWPASGASSSACSTSAGPTAPSLVDNATWTARPAAARLPPRRGQARHRQRHGGQGVGEGPDRGDGGHLLHRVQLHAAPGQRLPLAPRPRGLRAPDRRLRPVGQHHRRRRPDPPA